MKSQKIFIFAGEKSGDLHGSHLVRALKERIPGLSFSGVPGPEMRAEGVSGFRKMEDFEVMGFSQVVAILPYLVSAFFKIRNHILETKPNLVVLIDYPGMNLRLAKALRDKGYQGKIVQYISPSVWAWGKHRIETMASTLDLLLTIYPFEQQHFKHTSLNISYVGNPLCEYIKHYSYDGEWKKRLMIPNTDRLIALFPGSRKAEIKHNLPILLEAAELFKQKYPDALFGISCAHQKTQDFLDSNKLSPALKNSIFTIPKKYTYELMRDSRTALAKSGTVTLELALHRRPAAIIYKLSQFDRLYAKHILKLRLPHYCIVNIIAGQTIYPELIENGLNAHNLFHHLETLDNDGKTRYECMKACSQLRQHLGDIDASASAAESVMRMLTC